MGEHKTKEFFFISRQNGDLNEMVFYGDGICGRIFFISAQQGILKEMVVPKKAEFFFRASRGAILKEMALGLL